MARGNSLVDVSRETIQCCQVIQREALAWQRTTNLVAPSTINDFWNRHILDSLQLVPLIGPGKKILDIGSGGGFPALPLAVWQFNEGSGAVAAIESNRKKTSFLRQAAHKAGIAQCLKVFANRIEDVDPSCFSADVFTARALAPLSALLCYAEPWAEQYPHLRCLLHKGRDYQTEIDDCRGEWHFDLVEHLSMTSHEARILEITNLKRKSHV